MGLSKDRVFITLLLALWLCLPLQSAAQSRSLIDLYATGDDDGVQLGSDEIADQARRRSEQALSATPFAPLEGAVDPETYLVGPNDQFTVSIGGLDPQVSMVPVSADGGLVIPGIGRVEAGGLTLAQVEENASELLGGSFKNVPVNISLTRPREFWVHVSGAVPTPGRYLAQPVARLEDVLQQAYFLDTGGDLGLADDYRPALRNVTVKHMDGSSSTHDLVRYYRVGDTSQNPYLRDGDRILVPSYDPVRSSVFISGDLPHRGDYDFRPGDTILGILELGSGNVELDGGRIVRLTRRNDDGTLHTENYSVDSLRAAADGGPAVMALDHINVPNSRPNLGVAAADGFLRYPGQYPIEVGVTTLKDLVNMAGGFSEDALVRGAYLERNAAFNDKMDLSGSGLSPSARFEVITDSSSSLWQMRLGEFDYFSRQFLARWYMMDRRVSVDIQAAVQADAPSVFLQDGDRLFVPQDENAVFVIGEVARPGRMPLADGRSAEDYIAAAGGRGPKAKGTYVIRAGTGEVLPTGSPVGSGDYLFVDRDGGETSSIESERLRLMKEESKIRNRQTWFQAMTAAAAVVTTTILVIREVGN